MVLDFIFMFPCLTCYAYEFVQSCRTKNTASTTSGQISQALVVHCPYGQITWAHSFYIIIDAMKEMWKYWIDSLRFPLGLLEVFHEYLVKVDAYKAATITSNRMCFARTSSLRLRLLTSSPAIAFQFWSVTLFDANYYQYEVSLPFTVSSLARD